MALNWLVDELYIDRKSEATASYPVSALHFCSIISEVAEASENSRALCSDTLLFSPFKPCVLVNPSLSFMDPPKVVEELQQFY